ncbi:hypothetical protein HOP52_09230 [Halomonas campisalis]|uniref:Lipid/polyisoprenoid-binding YceI-like domain-containing protein n=1 Tax=Billgrantia campisalis TaxID=74661 RepID=A0ABS9P832_9GAMM|nr:hypothetical protein [Halomonas campisalis]MCG6657936.1 hypothetical protein [Halomonas campisalis]MDR5863539.1 hypothetical protein [Halomonas campisalis]
MNGWKLASLGALLMVGLAPASLLADRLAGTLDGKEWQWYILKEGNDANATFTDLGGIYSVDILGVVDPDSWRTRDGFSISLSVVDGELVDFDVIHLISTTAMPPVYTSEDADVRLRLESFSVEGNVAHVAGRVDGTLALQESLGEPPSLEEGIEVAVEFDIEALQIEF